MNRTRSLTLVALLAATTLLGAPHARAQVNEPVRPPRVEQPAKVPQWLYFLAGVGVIAVGVGLAVFPSRRTHED